MRLAGPRCRILCVVGDGAGGASSVVWQNVSAAVPVRTHSPDCTHARTQPHVHGQQPSPTHTHSAHVGGRLPAVSTGQSCASNLLFISAGRRRVQCGIDEHDWLCDLYQHCGAHQAPRLLPVWDSRSKALTVCACLRAAARGRRWCCRRGSVVWQYVSAAVPVHAHTAALHTRPHAATRARAAAVAHAHAQRTCGRQAAGREHWASCC